MNRDDRVSSHATVLLIDACVSQRDLYEVALYPDFHVLTATRGRDGLSIAVRERPDVIVLDVMMSGLAGWETCTRLKCEPETADIPVILLTGATDLDLSHHAAAVGASAILKKPCSGEQLRGAILAALRAPVSHPVRNTIRCSDTGPGRVIPIR